MSVMLENGRIMSRTPDIAGELYGKLTAIKPLRLGGRHGNSVLWQWKCECGNIIEHETDDIRSGHKSSCGCRAGINKAEVNSAFNQLYAIYRNNAEKRKLDFELTKYEFRLLTSGNCYYCNAPPSQVRYQKRRTYSYIFNGIDRVDNAIGYKAFNCVPCCRVCNYAKLESTLADFTEKHTQWVDDAYAHIHNPIFISVGAP